MTKPLSTLKISKKPWLFNLASALLMLILIIISLSVGVADFSWAGVFNGTTSNQDLGLFLTSRLPRTLAIILAGVSLAVAGMIIQVVLKNRFVEPSMVGATQSSALGLLIVSLLAPASPLMVKMSVATITALLGMMVFVALIKRLPATDYLMIPLVGIVFGGVVDSVSMFIAYQTDMMQAMSVWRFGDFSAVLFGRYEWLWLTGGLSVLAYLLADKLTIIGLGDDVALNLGVNQKLMSWFGIGMVAMVSSVVVVTVGVIPFVGLVVPNIVSRMMGDQLRKALPAVALLGASAVLVCDIISRTIRFPYEVPVATVFGVIGTMVFLWLLVGADKIGKRTKTVQTTNPTAKGAKA